MDEKFYYGNIEKQNEEIKFHCKRCGEVVEIKAENKGLRIKCPSCDLIFISPKEGSVSSKEEKLYLEIFFEILAILSGVGAFICLILMFVVMAKSRGRFSVGSLMMMTGFIINIFFCLGLAQLVKYFRYLCKNIEDMKNNVKN